MSFWVYLEENGKSVTVEEFSEGGIVVLGGSTVAELNVTYNYAKFFFEHLDKEQGLRWIHGKKASECVERLEKAVAALGTERNQDYWAATQGNAGRALAILLHWAGQYPNATFTVD